MDHTCLAWWEVLLLGGVAGALSSVVVPLVRGFWYGLTGRSRP